MAKSMNELIEILTAYGDEENKIKKSKIKSFASKKKREKNITLTSHPEKYYAGYLTEFYNKPIAVSENKELIKEYMENHRFLKPKQYQIDTIENISDSEAFMMYHDQFLVEYEGYYLPSIDTMIIDFYRRSMRTEIYNTVKNIGTISLLIKESELISPNEKDNLYYAMKTLTKFMRMDNVMEEIEHEDLITNSIIFKDIQSYLQDLARFDEIMAMHQNYEYQLYKDDEFDYIFNKLQ